MAMTNEDIITTYKLTHGITREIHTYNHWKSLGYQVQKGSKAVAKIQIWKYATKRKKTDDDKEEGFMYMKLASFFDNSQVKAIA